MPKYVDHDDRRRDILEATQQVLADLGPRGLTVRAVAQRMGGSSTVVTHYFGTREALIDGVVATFGEWPDQLRELEAGVTDPRARLRLFLQWLVPYDEHALMEERGRINLLAERGRHMPVDHLFNGADATVRKLLEDRLKVLVPAKQRPGVIDLLRAATNGITLATIEHPGEWNATRQFAVIDRLLDLLDLLPDDEPATKHKTR
ncbi:MAG: TetR/AcrR family transcriptional regulator [Actinomycetota bacterium]|nr:TetR/AcrR family transcriptional regulator [Actinomycetota bacterium]